MRIISKENEFKIEHKTAVTLGKFDGLHKGHQKLLNKVVEKAKQGYYPLAFTFDISPLSVMSGERVESLLTNEERRNKFEELGIQILIEFPFTKEIANMEPEDFIREILVGQCNVAYIAVGKDFRFGKGAKGDYKLLIALSKECCYEIEVIEKEQFEGKEISSTYVRDELLKGNLKTVESLLGYSYFAEGNVISGRQIGRTIGMPTANLIALGGKILPPKGVYVSRINYDSNVFYGLTNIGYNPTVTENKILSIETYIYEFKTDIYGKHIRVEFLAYMRPEYKFASLEELKIQIEKDMIDGKKHLETLQK